MRAFPLSVLLLGATTIAWAQETEPENAPVNPDPRPTLSADEIQELSESPTRWRDLETLANTAALPDRALAAPAARVATEIAHTIDAFDVDAQEIPRSDLNAVELRWLQLATSQDRWVDIRVYALDVASRLHDLQREHGAQTSDAVWRAFLEDADPQMRAAALILVPDAPALGDVIIPILTNDVSEEVSLAAGQRLCGPLRAAPSKPAGLDAPALARIWTLASNRTLPITARAHLAPCLIADGSIESRRALAVLLQRSPPDLRRHMNTLLRSPQPEPAP